MNLSFYGAAREVTGSCFCLEVNDKKILIDCGMQQGQDEDDNKWFSFEAGSIDYVLVTHAHIDHSGRLPLLIKQGFKGTIYTTKATSDLLSIMLRDSAHIQQADLEWKNRKGKRAGKSTDAEPLYTMADVDKTLTYVSACSYGNTVKIDDGISIRFIDAGHLLGSASIELWITENEVTKKIVFSGDIGNLEQPIIRNPQYITEADYVVMESTYGDRNHEPAVNYAKELGKIIDQTIMAGGNVVIPSFAVGRTQELLYIIREIKEQGLVKSNPHFPVYIDSPLATAATKIYDGNLEGYIDEETIAVLKSGKEPLKFDNLHLSETIEESKQINEDLTPKVIISSSGMCEAGRIRHHLKHNLWRSECSVVFTGFQANGTLGRILKEGAKVVKLFGEEISVRCDIYDFDGLSAHADQSGLLTWINSYTQKPKEVFVVHGENTVSEHFVGMLTELGFSASAPNQRAVYDLVGAKYLSEGVEKIKVSEAAGIYANSSAFNKLMDASARLLQVIQRHKNGSNKDLRKFTEQINNLSRLWSK